MGSVMKMALPIAAVAAPFVFPGFGAAMGLNTAGGLFGGAAAGFGPGAMGSALAGAAPGGFALGPAALAGGEALGTGMGLAGSLFGPGAAGLQPILGGGLGSLFGPEAMAGAASGPFAMTPGGMAGGMNAMFPGQIPGLLGDGSLSGLMDRFKDLDLGQLTDLMGGQQEQQQPQMMPIPAPPPIPPQRQETGSIAEAAERPSGTIPLSQEDVFPSGVSEYLQMLLAQQQSAPMRFGSVTRRTV